MALSTWAWKAKALTLSSSAASLSSLLLSLAVDYTDKDKLRRPGDKPPGNRQKTRRTLSRQSIIHFLSARPAYPSLSPFPLPSIPIRNSARFPRPCVMRVLFLALVARRVETFGSLYSPFPRDGRTRAELRATRGHEGTINKMSFASKRFPGFSGSARQFRRRRVVAE